MCELFGTFKVGKTGDREVYKGLIDCGVGKYNYQVYATEQQYLYLECDKKSSALEVNHSCTPNATIEEVI